MLPGFCLTVLAHSCRVVVPRRLPRDYGVKKIAFTTCADDGFIEGLKGLIKSIRKFYPPSDADVVVFFVRRNDYVAAFCREYAAEMHYFDEIDSWRRPLLRAHGLLDDTTHFYHAGFQVIPGLPHHTDRATLG